MTELKLLVAVIVHVREIGRTERRWKFGEEDAGEKICVKYRPWIL